MSTFWSFFLHFSMVFLSRQITIVFVQANAGAGGRGVVGVGRGWAGPQTVLCLLEFF